MRTRLVSAVAIVVAAFLLVTNPVIADAAKQVTSKQIKNNTIKGKDVKDASLTGTDVENDSITDADVHDGSLTGADVQNDSITGTDVAANTLTGADIDENTLVIPGKSGIKTFSGVSFKSRASVAYTYVGLGRVYPTAALDLWTLQLDLPQGATITNVTFYSVDNGATSATGVLTTYNPSNGGFADLGSASTSGSSGLEAHGFDTATVINNATSSYYLVYGFGATDGSIQLAGARVSYTFDATIGSGAKPYSGPSSE